MELKSYEYTVNARVELTGKELASLRREALAHYDAKCRSIARRGSGGWLRGMLMFALEGDPRPDESFVGDKADGEDPYESWLTVQVEKENRPYTHSLSLGQLDTLLKILGSGYGELYWELIQLRTDMKLEYDRVNKLEEGK